MAPGRFLTATMVVTGHAVDVIASGVWAGIGGGVIAVMLARGETSGA